MTDAESAAEGPPGTDPDADGTTPDLYPHIVDRADFDPLFDPAAPIPCDRCGGTMQYTRQCRIVCSNCGYTRDCSDP